MSAAASYRDVDLHLQINFEDETFAALGTICCNCRVEVVRLGNRVGPVQVENGCGTISGS